MSSSSTKLSLPNKLNTPIILLNSSGFVLQIATKLPPSKPSILSLLLPFITTPFSP